MKDRPSWNTTARGWNRKPGRVVVSIDAEHREVTLRTPPGEMGSMNVGEVRELRAGLDEAIEALERLE